MTASPVRIPFASHNRSRRPVDRADHSSQEKTKKVQSRAGIEQKHDYHMSSENRNDQESSAPDIFRSRAIWPSEREDIEEMWTLKRANPISDDSDQEDSEDSRVYESPTKRQRVQDLDWKNCISNDNRFVLNNSGFPRI